jgi:hypothetical protein
MWAEVKGEVAELTNTFRLSYVESLVNDAILLTVTNEG